MTWPLSRGDGKKWRRHLSCHYCGAVTIQEVIGLEKSFFPFPLVNFWIDPVYVGLFKVKRLKIIKTYRKNHNMLSSCLSDCSCQPCHLSGVIMTIFDIKVTLLIQVILVVQVILDVQVILHMGREHASREKNLSMVNILIFVHKNVYRIRFQKIKIGKARPIDKRVTINFRDKNVVIARFCDKNVVIARFRDKNVYR